MSKIIQSERTHKQPNKKNSELLTQQEQNFAPPLLCVTPEENDNPKIEAIEVLEENEEEEENVAIVPFAEEEVKHEEELVGEELIETIESVTTSVVDNVVLDIDKVTQTAFNPDKNINLYQGIARKLGVERKKGNNPQVNTFVSINFEFDRMDEKGLSIHGTEKLTPFDRIVLDAINTLYVEGHNEYITTQMVFHVMTEDENRRITPNYAEEINNSFIKLLFTHITIDATEEAKMYPNLKNFKYHSTILPGEMVQAILNGTEVACIHIYQKSLLYRYASIKRQVSRIDLSLVQKPFAGATHENKESMTLLYYLLRRIIALKRLSNVIRYETIYHELGQGEASPLKKYKIREATKFILGKWKGLSFGDILFIDYTEIKEDRTPTKVVLNFKVIKKEKDNVS